MRRNLFAMISTKASAVYTPHAVRSFFAKTPKESINQFLLIDNDGSGIDQQLLDEFPAIQFVRNETPKSFSQNSNFALETAALTNCDLWLLNNDLIFTTHWFEPVRDAPLGIASPVSNREIQYRAGSWYLDRALALEDFLGKEILLEALAQRHREAQSGFEKTIFIPFFCCRISKEVYTKLGKLDESFGKGGAEDNDYCLRSALQGFPITYAKASYILHFSGRSTWAGAESPEETKERDNKYIAAFEKKWGKTIANFMFADGHTILTENRMIRDAYMQGDFGLVVEYLGLTDRVITPSRDQLNLSARHIEPSFVVSADDDPGVPTEELIRLSQEIIKVASTVDLSDLALRKGAARYNPTKWPGEHYALLTALTAVTEAKNIVEVGTERGLSALALIKGLKGEGKIITYDIVPWSNFEDTCLTQADFKSEKLVQKLDDLSDEDLFEQNRSILENSELIFLDGPKDGQMEFKLFQLFETLNFKNPPLIIVDDIRLVNMIPLWRSITRPKLDMTSFGHWSGTGLIRWK